MTDQNQPSVAEFVESKICLVRGQQVVLDMHLVEMYEVAAEVLERAVELNMESFPPGSVFRLDAGEVAALEISIAGHGQTAPYAFTGAGMAMLASIILDEKILSDSQEICAPTCGCRGGS